MFTNYSIFLIPFAIALIVQLLKVIIESIKHGFNQRYIYTYGGMPSSHTALVVSLATIIGLQIGLGSAAFALAIVFAFLVIRDAIGFRRYLGEHSNGLNRLVSQLNGKQKNGYKHYEEMLGHNLPEVIVGAILAIILTLVAHYWIL